MSHELEVDGDSFDDLLALHRPSTVHYTVIKYRFRGWWCLHKCDMVIKYFEMFIKNVQVCMVDIVSNIICKQLASS